MVVLESYLRDCKKQQLVKYHRSLVRKQHSKISDARSRTSNPNRCVTSVRHPGDRGTRCPYTGGPSPRSPPSPHPRGPSAAPPPRQSPGGAGPARGCHSPSCRGRAAGRRDAACKTAQRTLTGAAGPRPRPQRAPPPRPHCRVIPAAAGGEGPATSRGAQGPAPLPPARPPALTHSRQAGGGRSAGESERVPRGGGRTGRYGRAQTFTAASEMAAAPARCRVPGWGGARRPFPPPPVGGAARRPP